MAILQISQIQVRRGLKQDLPQLASGELAWSNDTRQLYIGNGTLAEGAPAVGSTEILTQFSIINFTNILTANVTALQSNVTVLQGNITTINSQISALQSGVTSTGVALNASTSGNIAGISANNAVITYTLTQGTKHRTGDIVVAYNAAGSTVSYYEDYTETSTTDLTFSMTANSSMASLNYITTTATSLEYIIKSQ